MSSLLYGEYTLLEDIRRGDLLIVVAPDLLRRGNPQVDRQAELCGVALRDGKKGDVVQAGDFVAKKAEHFR